MNLICVSAELMFASQVEAVAKKAGFQVKTAPGRDALLKLADTLGAAVVCLDLDSLDVDVAELLNDLESVATRPESVIAVAAHVHEGRLESARRAGCDEILSRGAFHRHGEAILARLFEEKTQASRTGDLDPID